MMKEESGQLNFEFLDKVILNRRCLISRKRGLLHEGLFCERWMTVMCGTIASLIDVIPSRSVCAMKAHRQTRRFFYFQNLGLSEHPLNEDHAMRIISQKMLCSTLNVSLYGKRSNCRY